MQKWFYFFGAILFAIMLLARAVQAVGSFVPTLQTNQFAAVAASLA